MGPNSNDMTKSDIAVGSNIAQNHLSALRSHEKLTKHKLGQLGVASNITQYHSAIL